MSYSNYQKVWRCEKNTVFRKEILAGSKRLKVAKTVLPPSKTFESHEVVDAMVHSMDKMVVWPAIRENNEDNVHVRVP